MNSLPCSGIRVIRKLEFRHGRANGARRAVFVVVPGKFRGYRVSGDICSDLVFDPNTLQCTNLHG